jgi:putative N-acetyltransferase (TIGR04045 family)
VSSSDSTTPTASFLIDVTPAQASASCRLVAGPEDWDGHFRVRHAVFVTEQGIFARSDRDVHDDEPGVLHAVAVVGGRVIGAVRLYPGTDADTWFGDRLAILAEFRGRGMVGARLVRLAVVTARSRGARRMNAMIQLPNVPFFTSLGWAPTGAPVAYHGRAHQPMSIALTGSLAQ